jgi:hypothetical protein
MSSLAALIDQLKQVIDTYRTEHGSMHTVHELAPVLGAYDAVAQAAAVAGLPPPPPLQDAGLPLYTVDPQWSGHLYPTWSADDYKRLQWLQKVESLVKAKPVRPKILNPTKQKIISLCRRKALPGTSIARTLELSESHTRRVLAQLVRTGHLMNGADGYRTVRAT